MKPEIAFLLDNWRMNMKPEIAFLLDKQYPNGIEMQFNQKAKDLSGKQIKAFYAACIDVLECEIELINIHTKGE